MENKTYKDLFAVHEKFIELALLRTGLSHQFFKNIRNSGDGTERSIRKLIQIFVPDRFKIVSGYIIKATSQNDSPIVSDQLDVIIVDTLVPHRLFQFDTEEEIQAVPVEAVVGIFEVKRTLNLKSYSEAQEHLSSNLLKLGIGKKDPTRLLPGGIDMSGGLTGGSFVNPIIGVLGLTHKGIFKKKTVSLPVGLNPDIIASMDGFHMITSILRSDGKENIWFRHLDDGRAIRYSLFDKTDFGSITIAGHLALVFGFITTYLSLVSGRKMDFGAYFMNHDLWKT